MKASVIVLSWNGMEYLADCLDAVLSQDYPDFEVIVVDNGSTDGSADFVERHYPQVRLIRNARNLGFAGGNNVGLRAATGDVLVLLNQDTVVRPRWLQALVTTLEDPTIGIAGCKLLYPDGTIQHAGGRIVDVRGSSRHIGRGETDAGQYDATQDVDFVTGAALAVSREALTRVGPLDEGFTPAYYEDTDWSYRAREAGLRVVYCPDAVVTHHESTSSQLGSYAHHAVFHYGRLRFLLKHHPLDWLWGEFLSAEVAGIRAMSRADELMAMRQACLRLLFDLPEVARFRAQGESTADEWESLLSLVTSLRAVCVRSETDVSLCRRVDRTEERAVGSRVLEAARQQQQAAVQAETVDKGRSPESRAPDLDPTRQVLHRDWQIREPTAVSKVPMVAAIRQVWNNAAIRPYVMPMLQQQTRYNRAAAELITVVLRAKRELEVKQNEIAVKQNEIAVTQVEILHLVRDLLTRATSNEHDIAQSIREINVLAGILARLQDSLNTDEG
jgi:GT2 family glycosyltransferase